jgi:hypothetical protein
MARLTSGQRQKIPTDKFAGPNRSFPIPDKAHAHAAIALSRYAANPNAVKAKARAFLARHKAK